MKKVTFAAILMALLLVLIGCSQGVDSSGEKDEPMRMHDSESMHDDDKMHDSETIHDSEGRHDTEMMDEKEMDHKKSETSSEASEQTYETEEAKEGELVNCPVMGNPVEVSKDSLYAEIDGKKYYVCCAGCIKLLKDNPDKYLK